MIDPHEDLVEAVARALNAANVNSYGLDDPIALSRAAIDLIAERTKDATPVMLDACRQMQADQHFGVTTLWTAMHRACALWPKEKP